MGIPGIPAMSISTLWNISEKACGGSMGTWAPPSGSYWGLQILGRQLGVASVSAGQTQGLPRCPWEVPRGFPEGTWKGSPGVPGKGPRAPRSGHIQRPNAYVAGHMRPCTRYSGNVNYHYRNRKPCHSSMGTWAPPSGSWGVKRVLGGPTKPSCG